MRLIALSLMVLTMGSSARAEVLSTVASVQVQIGPELQAKAARDLGERDIARLAATLKGDVQRELERTGVLAGGRLELVLTDVRPSRPTLQQFSNRPGLSHESFGIGGATLEGQAISVAGDVTPIHFRWYADDIEDAPRKATWTDAYAAFDRFAYRFGRGESYATR